MNFYTVSQTSLAHSGSSVVEEYIPLWMADGTYTNISATTNYYLADGTTNANSTATTANIIHTLNSNWSPTKLYAFEATFSTSNSSGVATISLVDLTNVSSPVVVSTITTSVTTMTVIRSGQFTLIPGHNYGIAFKSNNTGYGTSITDASLIVFGQ